MEEAKAQSSSMPYDKTELRKGNRNRSRTGKLKTDDGALKLRNNR